MQISEAAEMLYHPAFNDKQKKIWADLGPGSGTFTLALASLLGKKSIIHAMDTDRSALNKIPGIYNDVIIEKQQNDFVKNPFPFSLVDGILIANAFHYVKDKKLFVSKIKTHLKDGGCILIVEYDTDIPVKTWVPFPISYHSLVQLFKAEGFGSIQKMQERASVFGGKIYSAMIVFNRL